MALDTGTYQVTREIAQRAGVIGQRYVTKDGHYILDKKDLSRIHLTSDEYVSGLQGVEKITREKALALIQENGRKMSENDNRIDNNNKE